jgi:uncharacterized protein (TIGR02646 family)
MLHYHLPALPAVATAALAALQARVDAAPGHAAQIAEAKRLFGQKPRRAFDPVRAALAAASPAGGACFYCERDRYRDIEHIRPKRHYPQRCFDWANYVYACTICNQDRKGDRYAVIDAAGALLEFDRRLPAGELPPPGSEALIDIRAEDPLDFFVLEFATGSFVAAAADAVGMLRADFTIGLFELNEDSLARIRRQMAGQTLDYIRHHAAAVQLGDPAAAARALEEILELPYPTILHEIRRQAAKPHLAAWAADIALLPATVWER